MACKYHWENRNEEGNHYSDMIDQVVAEIKRLGYEVNLFAFDLPDDSGMVKYKDKVVGVNCSCAGCAVMHHLHALASIEERDATPPDGGDSSIEYTKRVDERAEKIAERMELGLDAGEWIEWRKRAPKQTDGNDPAKPEIKVEVGEPVVVEDGMLCTKSADGTIHPLEGPDADQITTTCARCGVPITPGNDSGWQVFVGPHTSQSVCKECNDKDDATNKRKVADGNETT